MSLARLALRWIGQQRLLAWDAADDHLTGLANRSELQNRLDEGNGRARAILYLDLDDFKPVNDHYGHRVGDEVLAAVAGRLQGIGGSHLVARLGGDEFAVLINPLDDPDEPVRLAERARLALAKPISVLGQLATVGVCVGVAIDPTGSADGDHLLDQADGLSARATWARPGAVGGAPPEELTHRRRRAERVGFEPTDGVFRPSPS